MTEREVDVVLYGATGYTGQLIAQELDVQGASYAIAGRSPDKLDALAADLEGAPPVHVVPLDDGAGMRELAARGRVLLSAAGPYKRLGPPALEAALEAGAHFVDITGEQVWLREAYTHDQQAREAGLTIVNAMGFDVVPSDLAAWAAADELDRVTRLDLCLAVKSGLSAGTQRTMAASSGDWWVYENGGFHKAPAGRFVRRFHLPNLGESTGVFVPWGDVVTAPRTTGAEMVRTFFRVPEKKARAMHLTWPITRIVTSLPLVDRLLERRAPEPGGGPSRQERHEARFTILAEATGARGQRVEALVTGHDPYGLTGAAAARGAVSLARGEAEGTGVLTPTQAFGSERLLKMLGDFELELERLGA